MRGPKIHSMHLSADLHALLAQKQALETARERFSDLYTDVSSVHCLETCTVLRAFREIIQRWTGMRERGTGDPSYETIIEAHYLDEKTTDCLLRLQAFREDYRRLRTYARLQEQHHVYTALTRLIEGIEKINAQVTEQRHDGTARDDDAAEDGSQECPPDDIASVQTARKTRNRKEGRP